MVVSKMRVMILMPLMILCSFACKAQPPLRYSVLISEVMADPSPPQALPNAEYVEVRNCSGAPVNLRGWTLSDASTTATINAPAVLMPDSFLILCSTSNAVVFTVFGRAIGLPSFPSLDNEGDLLVLRSPEGTTIHAIRYSTEWYGNPLKKEGGWSLEMIDPHHPCGGLLNWKGSLSATGGTPGVQNSVEASNPDLVGPALLRAYSTDSLHLTLVFDEPLDSATAALSSNYTLTDLPLQSAHPLSPLFNEVELGLTIPMEKRRIYGLSASVADCVLNPGSPIPIRAGWSEDAAPEDVVINEILFDPPPAGADYVELLNRSKKILRADWLLLAGKNASGTISSFQKLSEKPFPLFPGDHAVVTTQGDWIRQRYGMVHPGLLLPAAALPSYPDDKGVVVLADRQGALLDEVPYSQKWHFGLITDPEGIALERIDPAGLSADPSNWHSAAASSGHGTPTIPNSQLRESFSGASAVTVEPQVFSPDNDGIDDFTSIHYVATQEGFVATIRIFNADGVLVRLLVRNAITGARSRWNWDGLDEKGKALLPGPYVIHTELFNLQGKKMAYRNAVMIGVSRR